MTGNFLTHVLWNLRISHELERDVRHVPLTTMCCAIGHASILAMACLDICMQPARHTNDADAKRTCYALLSLLFF
jgi:hypothetical protein